MPEQGHGLRVSAQVAEELTDIDREQHRLFQRGEVTAVNAFRSAMLRYIDATVGCLRAAGFFYQLADRALHLILDGLERLLDKSPG
ncbi:hypothetical protein OG203_29830 [Nocardia sp. NBC_01499]|uniref:hypothetical protein n=1 Tax=Nocardia sp. NBC_01499 TaxID=2903597 RepID=UPI00386B3A05